MEEPFNWLKEYLLKETVKPKRITEEADIRGLGIVLEDAISLLSAFADEYNVDMQGFEYKNYFTEGMDPGSMFRNLVFGIFQPAKLVRKKITLKHLAEVAARKKWFDPND